MFSHIRQIYSDKVPPLLAQRVYPSIAVGRSPFSRLKADLRAIMRGSRPCQPAGRQVLGHCGGRNVDFRCELLRLRTVSFVKFVPAVLSWLVGLRPGQVGRMSSTTTAIDSRSTLAMGGFIFTLGTA